MIGLHEETLTLRNPFSGSDIKDTAWGRDSGSLVPGSDTT